MIRAVEQRPGLIGRLAPAATLTPSQQRAVDLFDHAADAAPDVVRAIVFPIVGDVPEGHMTMTPGGTAREIAALQASGTEVEVRHSRLPLTTNLMDPAEVPAALALGAQQAVEDAPELAAFWS